MAKRKKTIASTKAAAAPRDGDSFPVVGIGASAGGIDALQKFFPAVSPDSGTAFVVVLHLDPERKSTLAELLARVARVPVTQADDGMKVEPNHVYVIAPDATLSLKGGRLRAVKPVEARWHRTPIDSFLISLASEIGARAACVILSGTGSDGTIGLRAIKARGGLALAQKGAEYDGMMRSAVSTGLVDFVLPAETIPTRIAEYFAYLAQSRGKEDEDAIDREASDSLAQICALLRARTGHEFKDYKDKTVIRRIQRRMQVLQIDKVEDFLARLNKEPHEIDLLFHDLLIGVTNFFRDKRAFQALEKNVIPRLFEGKGPDDTVRVWVPGCSTGEEAYSVAMLLREGMPTSEAGPRLQVFASDIDAGALEVARFGRYPVAVAGDVSAMRLQRHFVREDGTYRVATNLREMCLFSVHNLLHDPPFSKLDMISCRNLLIYLNQEMQHRVIPLFNYALRDSGYLFLGTSENASRHSRLFATIDKTHRIFQRRPQGERRLPDFPLSAPHLAPRKAAEHPHPGTGEPSLQEIAERILLDRYAPAYVLVNSNGDVLHSSERTGKYLELPAGTPDNNIFSMARRGLRLDLRGALHNAAATGRAVVRTGVEVDTNGGRQIIDLVVQPLTPSGNEDALCMVVFRDLGDIRTAADADAAEGTEDLESASVRQMEMELRAAKDRLQATTEELESSNEELKSSNEELSSMNEELQSANEELETSKEELQSINEELQTVNAELQSRVEELSRANSDIANLLASTQIATVFLDRNLVIKSFTPAAKDLFRLVESDAGRPLMHVRTRFRLDTLEEDAERVLRTLGTIERQMKSSDTDARYVLRILPYRTAEDAIGGVVLTFIDVTRITAAEARIEELTRDLRNRVENLETLLDFVPVGILFVEGAAGRRILANRHAAGLVGEEASGKGLRHLSAGIRLFRNDRELPPKEHPLRQAMRTGVPVPGFEGRLLRVDGQPVDVMLSATPLFDERGKSRGAIAAVVDNSERKQAEARQDVLLQELQHRVKNIISTIGALATRMLKDTNSLEKFSAAFLARLNTMGRMHELLSGRDWEGAKLSSVITAALASYATVDPRNIRLDGAPVRLTPYAAATLGMVFHELATNAVKYGAMSVAGGHVDVLWRVGKADGARRLSLTWTESSGPPVDHPVEEGFGTHFIRSSIGYELDGTAALEFMHDGLRCAIDIPLADGIEPGPATREGNDAR